MAETRSTPRVVHDRVYTKIFAPTRPWTSESSSNEYVENKEAHIGRMGGVGSHWTSYIWEEAEADSRIVLGIAVARLDGI